MHIRPKDYVLAEGLYFAVVSDRLEDDRVLSYLRYIKKAGLLYKLETEAAARFIRKHYLDLLFYSPYADIELHGIPVNVINKVCRPEDTVTALLQLSRPDPKQQDAIRFIRLLTDAGIEKKSLGITGSVMLNTHDEHSDIDVVVYGRQHFFTVRALIKQKLGSGELTQMSDAMWLDAYQRRACTPGFEQYRSHELKKYNKCLSGNSKVDISMIPDQAEQYIEQGPYKKHGRQTILSRVVDDRYAFDLPARYFIEHDEISEVLSYTATYIGQAKNGDMIEASGFIEQGREGTKRLLVGTSREAVGEYIKVSSD